eukprot:1149515-Pelagomonas_calceolata.AAC.1
MASKKIAVMAGTPHPALQLARFFSSDNNIEQLIKVYRVAMRKGVWPRFWPWMGELNPSPNHLLMQNVHIICPYCLLMLRSSYESHKAPCSHLHLLLPSATHCMHLEACAPKLFVQSCGLMSVEQGGGRGMKCHQAPTSHLSPFAFLDEKERTRIRQ